MDVAVVGNGMPALQAAAELAQITKKVNIVAVPASLIDSPLGRSLKESGRVAFFSDYEVKEIEGQASPERMLLVSKTDKTETGIPVRGIFVELGYVPNTAMFTRLVKTTPEGRIIIDSRNQTNIPGLFAAGDVTDAYAQQVVVAIGEGANAALSAYDYLLSTKT
jgi:alkyl hydroperoxide reductase subunit F